MWRTRTKSCSCQKGRRALVCVKVVHRHYDVHSCNQLQSSRSLLALGFSRLTSSFLTWPASCRSFERSRFPFLLPYKQANACCAVLARRASFLYIRICKQISRLMRKPMQRGSWGIGERLFIPQYDSSMLIIATNAEVVSKSVYYLSDLKVMIYKHAATKCCSRGGNRQSTHVFAC